MEVFLCFFFFLTKEGVFSEKGNKYQWLVLNGQDGEKNEMPAKIEILANSILLSST